jgi:hypothetical protein
MKPARRRRTETDRHRFVTTHAQPENSCTPGAVRCSRSSARISREEESPVHGRDRRGSRPRTQRNARRASEPRRSFEPCAHAGRRSAARREVDREPLEEREARKCLRRRRRRLLRERDVDDEPMPWDHVPRLERAHLDAVERDVERELGILDLRRRSEADGSARVADGRAARDCTCRRHDQPDDQEGRAGQERLQELTRHAA